MRRREFASFLGLMAGAYPLLAGAQQSKTPVIGFLRPGSADEARPMLAALRRGLSESGFVEGSNLRVEYRWGEGRYDRLAALAVELVRRPVDLIVAGAVSSARAAKLATATIPIVFTTAGDPVRQGLVANESRPEGNLTGVTTSGRGLLIKYLELLHDLVPKAATIGLLINPAAPDTEGFERDVQAAASIIGRRLHILRATSDYELGAALASLASKRAGGLILVPDPFFSSRLARIAEAATHQRLPTIYHRREFALAGGLLSYNASLTDAYRLVGVYAGRILKGAKPSDLPVQQPTKFELIVNLKTARALDLTIPESMLVRADEIIE
jgi:putative ABC transport system substrate-binding protein